MQIGGMLTSAANQWKRFPVTLLLCIACVALNVALERYTAQKQVHTADSMRAFGCAVQRFEVESNRFGFPAVSRDLHGFFDLWNGELWRIVVNGFHHAGSLHLVMNVVGLWVLGCLVEARMPSWLYLLFCVGGSSFSILPELLLGNQAVGISGGVCALFGLLLVARLDDFRLRLEMPTLFVQIMFASLLLGFPLTYAGILRIANVAHFAGLVYGMAVGAAFYVFEFDRRWLRRAGLVGLLVLHVAATTGLWFVMHPVWSGQYHWFLARRATNDTAWLAHMKQTVSCDPSLIQPWLELIHYQQSTGDEVAGWETSLRALRHHRTQEAIVSEIQKARVRAFLSESAIAAQDKAFDDVFGTEAEAWRRTLLLAEPETLADKYPVDATLGFHRQLKASLFEISKPSSQRDGAAVNNAMEGVTL